MTLEQISRQFEARRTAPGRFMARCPAHPDRSPSLSISSGRHDRVLITCFAGCDIRDILTAVGLRFADLFPGPPPTPQQLMKMERERTARAALHERNRRAQRSVEGQLRKLESIRNQLGAKLAVLADVPEGDEVARLFHHVCDRHRIAHEELEQLLTKKESRAERLAEGTN